MDDRYCALTGLRGCRAGLALLEVPRRVEDHGIEVPFGLDLLQDRPSTDRAGPYERLRTTEELRAGIVRLDGRREDSLDRILRVPREHDSRSIT